MKELEKFINTIYTPPNFDQFTFNEGIRVGANWQSKRSYSEKDMLNFAWFLLTNVGQYSNDKIAHFEGKYLEQFKQSIKE